MLHDTVLACRQQKYMRLEYAQSYCDDDTGRAARPPEVVQHDRRATGLAITKKVSAAAVDALDVSLIEGR